MKIFILSHFDLNFGPEILFQFPEDYKDDELKSIPNLMDLYDNSFFIHIFGGFKSSNYLFEVQSNNPRGKKELFLASILVTDGEINSELSEQLLKGFSEELGSIEDIFTAFDSRTEDSNTKKYDEIKTLSKQFFDQIPSEIITIKQRSAKIFVFGPAKSGKTTVINCLKKEFNRLGESKSTLPTTSVNLSKLNIGNLQFLTYDAPGQKKFQKLWKPYLKKQDGLVFIIDACNKEKYSDAKTMLADIANLPETKSIPLLILFNKIDIEKPDIDTVLQAVGIPELGERHFKTFLTSGLHNLGIDEAFDWFAEIIYNKLNPNQKSDVKVLLAKWDEDEGPEVISVYPEDAFDDPDLIAIRSFSISEFVFGGEKFKKTSLTMPFININSKASIFFDFIKDADVRGGRLPLLFAVFYNDRVPDPIIEQFNQNVTDVFKDVKPAYKNPANATELLKDLHDSIIKELKSIDSTVRALRVAERRYKELFQSSRDLIVIIDKKSGLIVDVNNESYNMLQRPRDDLIGTHIKNIQLNDDNDDLFTKIKEQTAIVESSPFEYILVNTSGQPIPVEINSSGIHMGGQNVIQCNIRDISERKRAENELKESEKRFRKIVELVPFPIIIFTNGTVKYINPMFTDLLGYELYDIPTGRDWSYKAYPDKEYRRKVLKEWKAYEDNPDNPDRDPEKFQFDVTCKDGNIKRIVFRPVYIDKGEPFWICVDLTERIKAEMKLKESEKKFKDIVERIPLPIIVFHNNDVSYINPKFTEILGYTLKDIKNGRDWTYNAYPDKEYRHEVIKVWSNYAENPEVARDPNAFKFDVACKNGEIKKIVFRPVCLGVQEPFWVCLDQTDKIAAENALREKERLYSRIVELMPLPVIIFSNGHVEYINPQFTDVFGYSAKDIPTGREWSSKAYPDKNYRKEVLTAWKEYTDNPDDPNRDPDEFQFEVTCKNGKVKKTIFRPVYIEKGKPFWICEIIK